MSDSIKLSILSPERRLEEKIPVSEVTLTDSEGQIQVLPGHAPMIGTLCPGMFAFKGVDGSTHKGVITTGFFHVIDDHLTMLAETLELQGEINVEHAKQMQREAEDALKGAELDMHSFKDYQLKLERALIRQQVAGKDHE